MSNKITDAQRKELEEKKAKQAELVASRNEIVDGMKTLNDQINSQEMASLQSSSEAARANRVSHRNRATFNADDALKVEEARLQEAEEGLAAIEAEIKELEVLLQ
jgi:hypothetical protein